MNAGKIFETDWKKSVDTDKIYFNRVKDSASSFGQDSSQTRFTLNNPYDCFAFYNFHFFPMELKSTKNTSISIQRTKQDKGKMIKLNQIVGLTEASKYEGIYAGFIFNFRSENNTNNTYWLNIKNFNKFLENTNKKSINEKDVIEYCGIFIDSQIKKVHYKYDIEELLSFLVYHKGGDIFGKEDL